jgi:uncharacterized protein YggE
MRLVSPLIAFLLALAAASPASAIQQLIDVSNDRWVEVTGEGAVMAAPDFARVTLGVTTTGKSAGEAMEANAKAANALVSLIKAEGIAPADIQTSAVSISPMFSQAPRAEQGAPAIAGYSVSNHLTVIVRDLTRLGSLLDKAVAAGANSAYGVSFDHNNLSALLDKARPLAVADAQGRDLRQRGRRQARPAHDPHRRGRPSSPRRLRLARLRPGRGGPDADRGGRGQADRDRDRAV